MIYTKAHGASLSINLEHLYDNWQLFHHHMASGKAAAVVKANAYGLGATKVASFLEKRGISDFFVAHLSEAIELRQNGICGKIYVLNGLPAAIHDIKAYDEFNLVPVIGSLGELENLHRYLRKNNQQMDIILHSDTGMNRLGFDKTEWPQLHKDHDYLSHCNILYIMSHLACADAAEHPYNQEQKRRFLHIRKGWEHIPTSLGNSAGILLDKDLQGDLGRPGIGLYGGNPFSDGRPCPVKPVVCLTAPIVQIRSIKAGEAVGYDNGWIAPQNSQIATISLGYADGWLRVIASKGYVMMGEYKLPIVGRISMDSITLDITHLPENLKNTQQEVEILGKNITINNVAAWANTIPYEILTSIGRRFDCTYQEKS
ncbi:MAG: alanine racemase [Alphaproteobacteria bacterium]